MKSWRWIIRIGIRSWQNPRIPQQVDFVRSRRFPVIILNLNKSFIFTCDGDVIIFVWNAQMGCKQAHVAGRFKNPFRPTQRPANEQGIPCRIKTLHLHGSHRSRYVYLRKFIVQQLFNFISIRWRAHNGQRIFLHRPSDWIQIRQETQRRLPQNDGPQIPRQLGRRMG